MRSVAFQFVFSLTALVVQPLLGVGARIQASYLVVDPLRHSATLAQMMECSSTSGMAEAENEPKTESDRDLNKRRLPDPTSFVLGSFDLCWTGPSQSGTGCGSPSGFVCVGGSGQYAAISALVNLPPLQVVRRLYFKNVHCRPPPFPSRLFRPPRVV
jgi:hypothetical protein